MSPHRPGARILCTPVLMAVILVHSLIMELWKNCLWKPYLQLGFAKISVEIVTAVNTSSATVHSQKTLNLHFRNWKNLGSRVAFNLSASLCKLLSYNSNGRASKVLGKLIQQNLSLSYGCVGPYTFNILVFVTNVCCKWALFITFQTNKCTQFY